MKLLPLLIYWQWEYGTTSTLNEKVPHNTFQQTFIPYANGKRLKEKLNGQTIELKVENMPATFSVVDKGGMVFLLLYAISWDRIFVDPAKQDMVVNYRLLKDGVETKKRNHHSCRPQQTCECKSSPLGKENFHRRQITPPVTCVK